MIRKMSLVLAALALISCQKKEDTAASEKTAETPKVEAPTPAAATPTTTAAPEIDLESLPTEEDFEDEAEKEITSQNLEKKLDELEKEIAAE